MKVCDRDRNVNKKLVLVVFLVKVIIKCWIPTNETVYGHEELGNLSTIIQLQLS